MCLVSIVPDVVLNFNDFVVDKCQFTGCSLELLLPLLLKLLLSILELALNLISDPFLPVFFVENFSYPACFCLVDLLLLHVKFLVRLTSPRWQVLF